MNYSRAVAAEMEMKFLLGFYDEQSPYYGKLAEAAAAAGYQAKNVRFTAQKIIERYSGKSFRESAQILGMTKPYMAAKVRSIIEDEDSKPETRLTAIKMLLNNFGEKTENTSTTVNVNTPKALVVVGTSQRKIDAMLQPQLEESVAVQP